VLYKVAFVISFVFPSRMYSIYQHLLRVGIGLFCLHAMFPILYAQKPPTVVDHWQLPVQHQGLDDSFAPQYCATCHADKYQEWQGSQHSKAFSPGLVGQIMDYKDSDARNCLTCHAPLAEQQDEAMHQGNLFKWARERSMGLAEHGVMCASCHVRGQEIVGPAKITEELANRYSIKMHPNAIQVNWFSDSYFCARCHQFPQDNAVNGKPLENTYQEWLESPFAHANRTCQSCHMPDKKHYFRGIHDKEMTQSGVRIYSTVGDSAATLTLQALMVGHRFPTYIVPRVELVGLLLDKNKEPIEGTKKIYVIQRIARNVKGKWEEFQDTRLKPGEKATVTIDTDRDDAYYVRFYVMVEPDNYYIEHVYRPLLKSLPDGEAKQLIQEAYDQALRNQYSLYEETIDLRGKPSSLIKHAI